MSSKTKSQSRAFQYRQTHKRNSEDRTNAKWLRIHCFIGLFRRSRAEASFEVDPDDKYEDVLAEINAIQEDLPDDLYSLDVDKFYPNSRVKIPQFALVSETLP